MIETDARWVKDKLLESWVDDEDEAAVVATLRRWALTPKPEGGNYLDDLLDELRLYSYYYDYLVSESVSINLLDKLYAEMEDERYSDLLSVIDTFSVKYAGYRGRGDVGRWSGLQTAVMPTEVRDRLSRVNQRLAGKVTLPMTPEEVGRINDLYAQLRSKTLGLIDMPGLQLGPGAGQQAAQALAVPVVGVAAIVYALILAILVTITLYLIIAILREIERALDRLEYSSEPSPVPVPVPPVAPPIAPPVPVPAPPIAPPIPVPIPAPVPVPRPNPSPTTEPEPEPRPTPEPRPGPEPIIDIFPPLSDDTERRRRRQQRIDLYHGTDEPQAYLFAAGDAVQAVGGGEFGQGFYTFRDLAPAELAAAQYTRARGLPMWGVVDFAVPLDVLIAYGLASALVDWIGGDDTILIFPDRTTAVTVRYPDDLGGIELEMNWRDFVAENRRLGGHVSWPYDLIIGPLSGRIPGWRDVNQFLLNNTGVQMLNDPEVDRSVASAGPT